MVVFLDQLFVCCVIVYSDQLLAGSLYTGISYCDIIDVYGSNKTSKIFDFKTWGVLAAFEFTTPTPYHEFERQRDRDREREREREK